MVKRVYFGDVANDDVAALKDINSREFLMLGLLAVAVLWMGLYPKPFTDVMNVSVDALLKHVAAPKLPDRERTRRPLHMNWLTVAPRSGCSRWPAWSLLVDLWVTDPGAATFLLTQISIGVFAALHLELHNDGDTLYGMSGMVVSATRWATCWRCLRRWR